MAVVTKKRKSEGTSIRSVSPKKKHIASGLVENTFNKDIQDATIANEEGLPKEGEGEADEDEEIEEDDDEGVEVDDDIGVEREVAEDEDEDEDEEGEGIEDDFVDEIEMIAEPKDVRRKIPIKYIDNRTRRQVTFAKRRHGIMKKAYELSVLTGANILLMILGHSGLVYTFSTPKLEPIVRDKTGKDLIRACLNDSSRSPTPQNIPTAN